MLLVRFVRLAVAPVRLMLLKTPRDQGEEIASQFPRPGVRQKVRIKGVTVSQNSELVK
jgi:hypothetical protein